VAQALGALSGDAGVPVLVGRGVLLPLRLDLGELELLGEDLRELLEGELDLEGVLAGLVAGLLPVALALALALACASPSPSPAPTPCLFSP
jgi:hypothetical protein